MWSQGTCEAQADVDSLSSKTVIAIKRIMTLCVPEVQPEVRFEKMKVSCSSQKSL
jgi:hypothetical protein